MHPGRRDTAGRAGKSASPTIGATERAFRESFCESLVAARRRRDMSLEQIADVTRIPIRSLERLESGEFERLPADVFVRGFLRSYARCVGLDADEIIRRYAECGMTPAPVASPMADELAGSLATLEESAVTSVRARPARARTDAPLRSENRPGSQPGEPSRSLPDSQATAEDTGTHQAAAATSGSAGQESPPPEAVATPGESRAESGADPAATAAPSAGSDPSDDRAPVAAEDPGSGPANAASTTATRGRSQRNPASRNGKRKKRRKKRRQRSRSEAVAAPEVEPAESVAGPAESLAEPADAAATPEGEISVEWADATPASTSAAPVVSADTAAEASASELAGQGETGTDARSPDAAPDVVVDAPSQPRPSLVPPSLVPPSLVIDDDDPEVAAMMQETREAEKRESEEQTWRHFLPPSLLDTETGSRRGALTLAVIILVIVATLTMSYLLRWPSYSGDGVTMTPPPSHESISTGSLAISDPNSARS